MGSGGTLGLGCNGGRFRRPVLCARRWQGHPWGLRWQVFVLVSFVRCPVAAMPGTILQALTTPESVCPGSGRQKPESRCEGHGWAGEVPPPPR